jgi:hypothetical protein
MGQCPFNRGTSQFQNQNCLYRKGNGGFKNGQHWLFFLVLKV